MSREKLTTDNVLKENKTEINEMDNWASRDEWTEQATAV